MFGQVPRTEFDLHFSMFGIPVRVHPLFWVIGAVMGWSPQWAAALGVQAYVPALLWIGVVFVSILVHELGHALTAQFYGWPPEITLYHFGGLASFRPTRGYTPRRSVLISLAGPGAGFLLYGLVRGVEYWMVEVGYIPPPMLAYVLYQAEWVNLCWGLVNLLPVLPLDGGHVAEEICKTFRPRDGQVIAIKLAIGVSAVVALLLLSYQKQLGIGFYPGLLFGMLCYMNFQSLQQYRHRGPW
jgi:Zn-dependent protease